MSKDKPGYSTPIPEIIENESGVRANNPREADQLNEIDVDIVTEDVDTLTEKESSMGGASTPSDSAKSTQNRTSSPGDGSERMVRTLYRHPRNRLIGGVCGGLAEYLGVDTNLIRVFWIILTLGTAGAGFLAYLLLWLLLPVGTAHNGQQEPAAIEINEHNLYRAGVLLVSFGALWLLANLGILSVLWTVFWRALNLVFWPAVLIGAGLLLLNNRGNWQTSFRETRKRLRERLRGVDGPTWDKDKFKSRMKSGLASIRQRLPIKRNPSDRMFFGVCGGIGKALGIDANLIRLLWVAFSIGSMGTGVLVYVLMGLLLPEEQVTEVSPYQEEVQEVTIIDSTVTG
jgi:phage shock protein C